MYAIKLNEDKSLVTTVQSTIYQNEKNADTLVFLTPKFYEDMNLANCMVLLRYVLPDGTGKSEEIEMAPEPHNKNYYRYNLKTNTRFTAIAGTIELWLTVIDINDDIVLKSGTATVEITPAKEIMDYMFPEDLSQIDQLSIEVKRLKKQKADDIISTENGHTIQLTADGTPIGRAIDLNTNPVWDDMDDFIVNPAMGSVSAILSSAEDGAVLRLTNGAVDEELTLKNSITIKGTKAGFAQNYKQEVANE